MKKLLLGLALAVCACSSGNTDNTGNGNGNNNGSSNNAGGYVGTWKGDVSGWTVTVVVKESTELGGTYYLDGTATTNKSTCLATGTLQGTITSAAKATLVVTDSGNADRQLNIAGSVSGNTLTGTFESQNNNSACVVARTAFTLTKQ